MTLREEARKQQSLMSNQSAENVFELTVERFLALTLP
jgi:hypothetical protein